MTKVTNEEQNNNANALLGDVVSPSRQELIECVQNLMGAFDTPIARRKYTNDFIEEVRKNGCDIMDKLQRNNFA